MGNDTRKLPNAADRYPKFGFGLDFENGCDLQQ